MKQIELDDIIFSDDGTIEIMNILKISKDVMEDIIISYHDICQSTIVQQQLSADGKPSTLPNGNVR